MKDKGFEHHIKYIIKGLALAYVFTLVLVLVVSFLLTYTRLKESTIPLLNTIIMIISISVGAIYIAVNIGERGWLNGGILGVFYFVILILFNYLFVKPFTFDIFSISKFFISLITGIIGGILGINLK